MIHPDIAALALLFAVGCIASAALMGTLDEPAPGDYEHDES